MSDARRFLLKLLPAEVAAKGATSMVKNLTAERAARVPDALRERLMEEMIRDSDVAKLSTQGQDTFRRDLRRIMKGPDAREPTWASFPAIRASVSLALWQSALESALVECGEILCSDGEPCAHESQGFQQKWTHFIGTLRIRNADQADEVADQYSKAHELVLLRNRLVHGEASADDFAQIQDADPEVLVAPIEQLRSAVLQSVLELHFGVTDPGQFLVLTQFEAIGLSLDILAECLASTKEVAA